MFYRYYYRNCGDTNILDVTYYNHDAVSLMRIDKYADDFEYVVISERAFDAITHAITVQGGDIADAIDIIRTTPATVDDIGDAVDLMLA